MKARRGGFKRRNEQQKMEKKRAREKSKSSLRADRSAVMRCNPRLVCEVTPVIHIKLPHRFMCEKLTRAHSSNLAFQNAVIFHQNILELTVRYIQRKCGRLMSFLCDSAKTQHKR